MVKQVFPNFQQKKSKIRRRSLDGNRNNDGSGADSSDSPDSLHLSGSGGVIARFNSGTFELKKRSSSSVNHL